MTSYRSTCKHVARVDPDMAIVCVKCMTVLRNPMPIYRKLGAELKAEIEKEWEKAKRDGRVVP